MKINPSSKKIIKPTIHPIQKNKKKYINFFPICHYKLEKFVAIKDIKKNNTKTIHTNLKKEKINSINQKKIKILIKLHEKLINTYEEIMNIQI
ncbi:Flagellar hook-basal body complex protein FliE [Buchnera aphidicola (Cinara kochiana kochiana)]|uniref:Flagellar hook-basal body complex protein FliE n=1 Tax=Buchnera aphidicola (Cinara kochiana kochiana) TaxID=2518976 RepID=A0A451D5I7_9GAMM|nr:hypothetical protein [Buchnera aphidicola]VFP80964.1 Flagellar hook-basal body complex protein FliE [Buchnera aphidicola (Cinara kochiana kochiana)]